MITIKNQTTDRTVVNSLAEFLPFSVTTSRTILRRICRIDKYYDPTSFFRFVDRVLYELTPSHVRDALRKASIFHHLRDRKVLEDNGSVMRNDPFTDFMSEVGSSVSDPLVDPSYCFLSKTSLWGSLLFLRESTLDTGERLLVRSEESSVPNLLPRVCREEALKTHVDPNYSLGFLESLRFIDLYGEGNKPLVCRGPLDSGRLDPSLHLSMEVQSDISDFPDLENRTFKDCSSWILRKTEGVVPELTSEPGITSFLVSLFYSTEEILISLINSVLDVLENLGVDLLKDRDLFLPLGQELVRVEEPEGLLFLFPRDFSSFKGLVINPSTEIDPPGQSCSLSLSGIESVFKSFTDHLLQGKN